MLALEGVNDLSLSFIRFAHYLDTIQDIVYFIKKGKNLVTEFALIKREKSCYRVSFIKKGKFSYNISVINRKGKNLLTIP